MYLEDLFGLKGKVAVVTGGARGTGKVVAQGNTLLIQRMDEAFVSSCDISLNKAWSACSLKQGTHEITSAVQPGQSLYGLQLTNQQRIIIFGGGLPVIFNEQVIGAVGVSGGTVEQDQLLAQCALDCFSAL